ncbi:hypothetical protein FOZ62_025046 [Perkinsus olseni]|uniref:Uncharacterized protein n=1 Tax=Perkinsus olseni TaxID=32597 RepID=A0A7J6S5C1_PEROL|nr:hypothetical protein FOZ62_025046 [Perkinsus olseni]
MSENVTVAKTGLPYIFPKQLIDLTGVDHLDEADWVDYIILTTGFIALIWWLTTRIPMLRAETGPDDTASDVKGDDDKEKAQKNSENSSSEETKKNE